MTTRIVHILRKNPRLSWRAFGAHLRGPRARLVRHHARTLGIVGYTQMHNVRGAAVNTFLRIARGTQSAYDGAEELWVDRERFEAALETPAGQTAMQALVQDERHFLQVSESAIWLADEHVVREGKPEPAEGGRRKIIWAGRGLPQLSEAEFQEHYLQRHAPIVAKYASDMSISRYVQVHTRLDDPLNETLRSMRGGGPAFPVHAVMSWDFSKVFTAKPNARVAREDIAADEKRHIDFSRSAIWVAEENIVIPPPGRTTTAPAQEQNVAKLENQVAVVTGAATGIGRATALELARRGCDVALATRKNLDGLQETANEIRAMGRKASVHQVDVSKREQMEKFPEEVVAEHGRVNILVNNAGVTLMGEFEDLEVSDLEWIVNINLWGVLYGCKFFLPYLKREKSAHIANISSMQGILGLTSQTMYVATKFAVRGFSESLRGELSPHGIGVSVHFPGIVKTNVVSSSRTQGEEAERLRRNLLKVMGHIAMEPDACARKIVNGIEKNRARVLITAETYIADTFKRIFPTGTDTVTAMISRGGIPDI